MRAKRIFWIYLNRFDENISKAPRLEMAEYLINSNITVTLLTGFRKEKKLPKKYRLKLQHFKGIDIKGLFKLSLSINIFIWLIKQAQKDDIIIIPPASLWTAYPLKLLKKCKIHLDVRTIPVEINNFKGRIDYILHWFLPIKFFHWVPDGYSFITNLLRKNIENEFNIKFNKYVLWHSGVNLDHFAVTRRKQAEKNNFFTLTYIGVITKSRGIDFVLKAINYLKNEYKDKIHFQIIGDGSYLTALKHISNDLDISNNIDFKGYVQYEDIPEHLINTDCFICPLPDKTEWNISSPIKIFEYFACAKPIILTPIVAHKNIINTNSFIVWTAGFEVKHYANAIKYAYKNIYTLKENAKFAPNIVRNNYEWQSQGREFASYLKKNYY